MTYLTMPRYVNKILRDFLTADENSPQPRTNIIGIGIAFGSIAAWMFMFWLITQQLWNLP